MKSMTMWNRLSRNALFNKEEKITDDRSGGSLLTHPVLGIPVFFGIMALVFFLTLPSEISERVILNRDWIFYLSGVLRAASGGRCF